MQVKRAAHRVVSLWAMLSAAVAPLFAPDVPPPAWRALDDPREWADFGRPLADRPGRWESAIAIEGMHCTACTLDVERALLRAPGVEEATVSGATATARLVWRPEAGLPSGWLSALAAAGYGALPAGDADAADARRQAQRTLLWRWMVAGFCMMQVMMYATPAYVTQPGEITPDMQALLRWASWVLTLPVVLFSGWPFVASALRDLRHGRAGMDVPVALGILVAFGASSAATFDPSGPLGAEVWYDSVTMFVFFLLSGRLLEQRLRDRTAGALGALVRRLPETVERLTGEGTERVSVRRLDIGDRLRIFPGDVFPADGAVLEGETTVDEALLTGESAPLRRRPGDPVVAGTHNLSGVVEMCVLRVGKATRYAAIAALMQQAAAGKPRAARAADRLAGPFVVGVLLAALVSLVLLWPAGPAHAVSVAIAILVVTCPCALSLATPAATLAAAGALARRGVLVRNLQALETAASLDTVAFDKTGTLTHDSLVVTRVRTRAGVDEAQALGFAATLARHSRHPVSRALAAAGHPGQAFAVEEVAGHGVRGDVALPGGGVRGFRLGSAAFCGAPGPVASSTQVHLADAQGWLATFELDESMRTDAPAAVAALQRQGAQVLLVSGDQPQAVRRLAARAGIDSSWGGQSPEAKLERLRHLQRQGHRVAMVGDGLNDGPVLAHADVSVALGQAVPLAQAQADFIVPGGQVGAVPSLLAHARKARRVMWQNLGWAAGYNAVCVPLAVAGAMPPWLAGLGMAASSLLVVMNSARLSRMD
jgi:P-type Cu2+ transporter